MPWFEEHIDRAIAELSKAQLLRDPKVVEGVRGPFVSIAGTDYLSFCSNDYLGLAQDPRLARAAASAVASHGWGAGSSRLLSGTTSRHRAAESSIAEFLGVESALVFTSGAAANAGLLTSLADDETLILSDELNHASVVDACRLSKATVKVYPHGDVAAVERLLAEDTSARKMVFSDTVFSMDGDLAPLADLRKAADRHGAALLVDDAHGFGVLGGTGRGATELAGVSIEARTANLAKAAGSMGGFVAGSRSLIRLLESRARSFMFTTAPPAAVAAAGEAAIGLIREAGPARKHVVDLARRIEEGVRKLGYPVRSSPAPIIPVLLKSEVISLAAAARLFESGFLVPAIRPPTVPRGTSRLRISVTALHQREHVDALLEALAKL